MSKHLSIVTYNCKFAKLANIKEMYTKKKESNPGA